MAVGGAPARVTTHRFFLPPSAFSAGEVQFSQEATHQIGRVLRLRRHDEVIVLDGTGLEYVVRLEELQPAVTGRISERRANQAEPRTHLTLHLGMLKAAKLELVLQKGTEIGVSRFVPMLTERAVAAEPGTARQRRFDTIVREAAEQSGRGRIPEVGTPLALGDALNQARGPKILLWEEERTTGLGAISLEAGTPVNLLVGPEGGFSSTEVALARDAGAALVSLGRRILRAETAAMVAAALVLARFGELGGDIRVSSEP